MARVTPGRQSRYAPYVGSRSSSSIVHGEQVGVRRAGRAVAVLVRLDLDHRRLGRAVEAGDAPAVRVRFLALVRRPVHQELAELGPVTVVEQMLRQGGPVGVGDLAFEGGPHGARRDRRRGIGTRASSARSKSVLEHLAEAQHFQVPLHRGVDLGEAAVVELVAAVERELEVVVLEHVDRFRIDARIQGPRISGEVREQGRRARATGTRESWFGCHLLPGHGLSVTRGSRGPNAPGRAGGGHSSHGRTEHGLGRIAGVGRPVRAGVHDGAAVGEQARAVRTARCRAVTTARRGAAAGSRSRRWR